MKNRFFALFVFTMIPGFLVACSGNNSDTASSEGTTASSNTGSASDEGTTASSNADSGPRDIASLLSTVNVGAGKITDIKNYRAIGVGSVGDIGHKRTQAKRNLFADIEESEESEGAEESKEIEDTGIHYTLLGETLDGTIESLSLLSSAEEAIDSSSLNVTYFRELGDFLCVSIIPMRLSDYYSILYPGSEEGACFIEDPSARDSIENLDYFLPYSFKLNEEFIDTSYLIHKRGGKIFPFSSHKFCIDAKIGAEEGTEFIRTYTSENQESSNYTAFDAAFPDGNALIAPDSSNLSYVYADTTFEEGFITGLPSTISRGSWETCYTSSVISFDGESEQLKVETGFQYAFTNAIDVYGNVASCTTEGRWFFYNVRDEKANYVSRFASGPSSETFNFDRVSKRFYYRDGTDVIFLGKDLSDDYTLKFDELFSEETNNLFDIAYKYFRDNADLFLDKNILVRDEGLPDGKTVFEIHLDEKGQYNSSSFEILGKTKMDFGVKCSGNYYSVVEDEVHVMLPSKGYEEIAIHSDGYLAQSVGIEKTCDGFVVCFNGYDKATMASVHGYIDSSNALTLEPVKPQPRTISVFSPIN